MTSTPAAVPTPIQHSLRISQMAVTADGKVCSLAYGSEFMLVESSTGEILFNSSNSTPEAPIFKDSIRGFAMHSKAAALGKNLMAVITTDKKLTCLDISNPSAPTIISQVENMKRASTVCFSRDGKRIIIADKFGDVYANTTFESDGNHLLTGHVSMILDTIMSHDGKFLLTADRDEKVRVSRYPNCFQVESFCLGHTQFVSAICIPSFSPSTMLSGGGDRFICLWDFEKGVELDRFDLTPYWSKKGELATPVFRIVACATSKQIAVILNGEPSILLLSIENGVLSFKQQISLTCDVLDANFDAAGHMWFSYGTNINSTAANTNTTTSSSPIVGISRFDDKSNTYLPVNNNDVLINKINATGTKSVEKVPEYYEKIVMGMENVKNKAGLNKHSAEHKRKVTDFVESIANGQPISNKKAKIVKASNNVAADSKPQETKAKLKEEVKAADV